MAAEGAPKSGEYQDGKLWFQRRSSVVTIGLTDMAIEEIGSVQKIDFPDEGEDFGKGEVVLTIDGSNGSIEVTTPAAGLVQSINEKLTEEPDTVTEDPLEEGWLIKLEIEDPSDLKEYA
ncbi:MAG: hypothetical protein A2X94_14055 [Bdellovibrionales bacterium GWB1_55_8]|nr:MAG: hypothetical protein A2X94_14055 [Bdellovibrionales bacterium GWB1_55_8]